MDLQKKIGILAVILGVLLFSLLVRTWKEEKGQQELLEKKNEIYKEMEKQIRMIQEETEKEERVLKEMKEKGFVCLAFRADNPNIRDTILPSLKEYGWKGTLILPFSEEETKSILSDEEIFQLVQEGWEIAVAGNAEEILTAESGLEQFQKKIQEKGWGNLQGYFFDKGDYSFCEPIYEQLESIGCGYGCPIGTQKEVVSRESEEFPSILECQNLPMDQGIEEIEYLLLQTQEKGVPVVLTDYTAAGTRENWEMNTPDYPEIFRMLSDFVQEGKLLQGNFQECTSYRSAFKKEKEEKEQQFREFRQEQERKMEDIKNQYQNP